ncbi:hypothetical protein F66182_12210, partial [Fusarium sp. NRRL 66182]
MANSKFEYVRLFEQPDNLLRETWIVVRIDGRGFHKCVFPEKWNSTQNTDARSRLSDKYKFEKPNDRRALDLMNAAAVSVMKDLPDLIIAYGVSDEYSFVFHPNCDLFERRSAIKQAGNDDSINFHSIICHINNLYNTTFWALVLKGGLSNVEAEKELSGTVSSDKNEILFSRFGINYNNEEEIYKKGSVVYRQYQLEDHQPQTTTTQTTESQAITELSKTQQEKMRKLRRKAQVVVEHVDIIKDEFWQRRPWLLSGKP